MRLDRFDLNLLVVLDVLLEERNVTRAGERLHIGQSGTSAALRRLREHFGDDILVPMGRQLKLTPLGESLIGPVREALHHVRCAIARQPSFDPSESRRHFVICASDYAITALLGEVVRRVSQQAPGVTVDIRNLPKDVVEVFDRGGIDLLVVPQQYAQRIEHPQQPLFEDTHICLVWQENSAVGDELTFEQYLQQGHVTVRFGDEHTVAFEEWFLPRYGKQRRVECSVDNFGIVPLLILGTNRIATVYRRLAEHFMRSLPLRMCNTPFDMPMLVETMVWPRHVQDDPAHLWLRDIAIQASSEFDLTGAL